jgi:hypothetical protein|tara:strand:- start:697 stop:1119 length:423 start_codon:yes stop_codon:yes gene_type:complete
MRKVNEKPRSTLPDQLSERYVNTSDQRSVQQTISKIVRKIRDAVKKGDEEMLSKAARALKVLIQLKKQLIAFQMSNGKVSSIKRSEPNMAAYLGLTRQGVYLRDEELGVQEAEVNADTEVADLVEVSEPLRLLLKELDLD